MPEDVRREPEAGDAEPGGTPPRAPGRRSGIPVLRLAVAAALVAAFVWGVDLRALGRHLDGRLILAAVAAQPLQIMAILIVGGRFQALVGSIADLGVAVRAYFLSAGLNVVIPGRLSELLKVTYLSDKAAVATSVSVTALVVERLFDLVCLGMLVAVALGSALFGISAKALAAPVVGLAVLLFLGLIGSPKRVVRLLPFGRRFVASALEHAGTLLRDRPRLALVIALSAAGWAASFCTIASVIWLGGSIPLGVGELFTVFVAIAVGRAIPALPAGLGTYEAAAVLGLTRFGYSTEEALALGLTAHGAHYLLVTLIAFAILLVDGTGVRSLLRRLRPLVEEQ